jgi:hypothetical protein
VYNSDGRSCQWKLNNYDYAEISRCKLGPGPLGKVVITLLNSLLLI